MIKTILTSSLLSLGMLMSSVTSAAEYQFTDLGTIGGNETFANDVNDVGQVVGYSESSSGEARAFLYDSTNGMQDLGTLGGDSSFANGINNAGQVVGYSRNSIGNVARAFLYESGAMQNLGALGVTSEFSFANGINDSGQVVGRVGDDFGLSHAFLYDSTNGMQDLGTLPGHVQSSATDINNAGQVVGYSVTSAITLNTSGENRAFLYDSTNGMQDLGTLGGDLSRAFGINNAGQVVGYSTNSSGENRAFLYENDSGSMVDLNTLVMASVLGDYTLINATAINDLGWIVGDAYNSTTRQTTAYLLSTADVSAVPVPAALPLMASALGMFGFMKRRKKLV